MRETLIILAWWVAFGGTHILLSSNVLRPRLVGAMGEKPFLGLYSLVALATIIQLFWVYLGNRHVGPVLWRHPPGTHLVALALVALGMVLLGPALIGPTPSSLMTRGMGRAEARGITRVTRHPLSMGFFLFGLAHCLVLGVGSDLAFFGGFCAYTLLSTWHQDARKKDQVSGYAEFRAETSVLPFLALALGRQPLGATLREIPWAGVGLGAAIFAGFAAGHGWLFGVPLF